MFEFIAFIFKICFAIFFGGLINYSFNEEKNDNNKIIYSSLISLFSCSLIGLALQFPENIMGIFSGASVITVIGTILVLSKDSDINSRIIFIFSAVIGMIVANGLIFQAIAFTIVIIIIKKYSITILDSLKIEEEEEEN
tara:strand:- start:3892 stop:4308 length:417 start_codon:yes stop_codon:yes gene_type:complete